MFIFKTLSRSSPSITALMLGMMLLSLALIHSYSNSPSTADEMSWLTPQTIAQGRWLVLALLFYIGAILFDYQKLREWAWLLYLVALLLLLGVFYASPIAGVHRWYRIPWLGMSLQPSQPAHLAMIVALSWLLEKDPSPARSLAILATAGAPLLLILRQPDLGSALVIVPILWGMLYAAQSERWLQRIISLSAMFCGIFVGSLFSGIISHEQWRQSALQWIHEYQYDRLSPTSYHLLSSQTAVALGRLWGKGWTQGSYAHRYLPEPYTDSIFAAFTHEFGFVGGATLLLSYLLLIYRGFYVALTAPNRFGQLLAVGLTMHLTTHVIINIAMMMGLLPITGVPLPLLSYGGSAAIVNATALGILQSIWARRFMF